MNLLYSETNLEQSHMITHKIYLHPEVKQLVEQYIAGGNTALSPENFAQYIIENKHRGTLNADETIFASLIVDSLEVSFTGNTNNGGNAQAHQRFPQPKQGAIFGAVAPDLSQPNFQDLFQNPNNISPMWRNFYWGDVDAANNSINEVPYKKHFRIGSENAVYAAKTHDSRQVIVPGLGLGIYAGNLTINQKAQLSEWQFNVLQELARNNPEIDFRFFGLGANSARIGRTLNIEGIAYNARRPMIEAEAQAVLRVVAGSTNIRLGGGSGDNGQIGLDTNVNWLLGQPQQYMIVCGNETQIIESRLVSSMREYLTELRALGGAVDINQQAQGGYGEMKSLLRELHERDFSRFTANPRMANLIAKEQQLVATLTTEIDNLNSGFLQRIVQLILDVYSWISCNLNLSPAKKFADRIAQSIEAGAADIALL